jgi:hypothetical protein
VSEIGTRGTQLHVLSVEDRYVLLAIQYMITDWFTGCICKPWWLYICSQLRFTRGFLSSTPSRLVGPAIGLVAVLDEPLVLGET